MTRTRDVVIAMIVCAFSALAIDAFAQAVVTDGWVVLPVDEYRALRTRANPDPPRPPDPPVEATLTRVDYDLRLDGDSVAGRALLTIDVFREGWVRVNVPQGLLVRDANLDGQPVSLVEGPPPHVLLSRAGRSVLALDLVLPLTASAGTESIALPASAASISRVALTLPRTGVDLSVTGGFVSERTESAAESRWTAFGRPNQPLAFAWKRKVDDRRSELPLRLRARVSTVVNLGEDMSLVTASIRAEVIQGLAREVTISIPQGLVVNQVNGATIADWEIGTGSLRVRFLDPIATEASFVVSGESRLPADGTIGVPVIRVPAAERETGGIAVDVLGAGEIAKHQARGLDPADVSELGDVVRGRESPSMVAFRMRPVAGSEPRSLNVSVVRYTPQAVLVANIEEARYRVLAAEDGRLLVQGRYAVRNNQRSFLKVTMPRGATIWSASVSGRPVRPGVAEQDAVLVALEKGRAGEEAPTFAVEIVYLQAIDRWIDKAAVTVALPAIDLPISRTGLELYYSPRYRVDVRPGAFREEADPGVFAAALRRPAQTFVALELSQKSTDEFQKLIDRFRNEGGGRTVAGAIPVSVTFPMIGPSLFVASELTAESKSPSLELAIRRIAR